MSQKTLAEYLAETNDDPYLFFTKCFKEIHRATPSDSEIAPFVNRDFLKWQRSPNDVPYYVKRHFEREYELTQGLPPVGAKLPDLYHVGGK